MEPEIVVVLPLSKVTFCICSCEPLMFKVAPDLLTKVPATLDVSKVWSAFIG